MVKETDNAIWQSCCPEITDFVQNSLSVDLDTICGSCYPPDKLVDALQKTMYGFVWNRKQDRTSRKIAIKILQREDLEYLN